MYDQLHYIWDQMSLRHSMQRDGLDMDKEAYIVYDSKGPLFGCDIPGKTPYIYTKPDEK